MTETIKIAKAVKEGLQCEGINLIQSNEPAGHQTVFHFHMHVMPRWSNDSVNIDWDSTPADPQIKLQTLEKIAAFLSK